MEVRQVPILDEYAEYDSSRKPFELSPPFNGQDVRTFQRLLLTLEIAFINDRIHLISDRFSLTAIRVQELKVQVEKKSKLWFFGIHRASNLVIFMITCYFRRIEGDFKVRQYGPISGWVLGSIELWEGFTGDTEQSDFPGCREYASFISGAPSPPFFKPRAFFQYTHTFGESFEPLFRPAIRDVTS